MKYLKKVACLAALMTAVAPSVALSESPASGGFLGDRLGSVGSFTNDALGDGHDRWQSASYQKSWFYSHGAATKNGALELRARGQIVTPWDIGNQPTQDRPFGASLGLGLFKHGKTGGFETRFGAEFLAIGDQTQLDVLQYTFHDLIGYDSGYDTRTRNDPHIDDSFNIKAEAEIAKRFQLGESVAFRPYITAEAGAETAVRLGGDLILGSLARSKSDYWTRDAVTGQALSSKMHKGGFSVIAGIDKGYVYDSYLLPDNASVSVEKDRTRARFGVQADIGGINIFFGQAMLSEEFVDQSEKQIVGMFSVGMSF